MELYISLFVIRKCNKVINVIPLDNEYTEIDFEISLKNFSEEGLKKLKEDEFKSKDIIANFWCPDYDKAINLTFEFDDLKGEIEYKKLEVE